MGCEGEWGLGDGGKGAGYYTPTSLALSHPLEDQLTSIGFAKKWWTIIALLLTLSQDPSLPCLFVCTLYGVAIIITICCCRYQTMSRLCKKMYAHVCMHIYVDASPCPQDGLLGMRGSQGFNKSIFEWRVCLDTFSTALLPSCLRHGLPRSNFVSYSFTWL